MSEFKLTAVEPEPKIWQSDKYGAFAIYDVTFEGSQGSGRAQIKQKDSTRPPEPGETIDAEIVQKNGQMELKKLRKEGSAGGGASKGDFRTPEQIMRSDAHGKAMHWCDVKVAAGEWVPISWDEYLLMVDRFYEDLRGAS